MIPRSLAGYIRYCPYVLSVKPKMAVKPREPKSRLDPSIPKITGADPSTEVARRLAIRRMEPASEARTRYNQQLTHRHAATVPGTESTCPCDTSP